MISFTVYGISVPQGSMKSLIPKGARFPVVLHNNPKIMLWRQEIAGTCLNAMNGQEPAGRNVPIRIQATFYFPKPKSVRSLDKTTAPDLDKLVRCLGDALTGICYEDDAQVTELHAMKLFGNPPRMEVEISEVLPPAKMNFSEGAVKAEGPIPF